MATTVNNVPRTAQITQDFIAGTGGVTGGTFVKIEENIATEGTSGHCMIALTTADAGKAVTVVIAGAALLSVNGNSVNIVATDKIKPTTAGLGEKADTNKDDYSCIAFGASTTDADVIRVVLSHGVANI